MILVDTSAWVEYLRATGSDVHRRVRQLVHDAAPSELGLTEVVAMELLAGALGDEQVERLRRFIGRFAIVPGEGLHDAEAAAHIYRTCRRSGETVRRLTDCLVAAVAIRAEVPLLHRDRDFDVIARCSALEIAG